MAGFQITPLENSPRPHITKGSSKRKRELASPASAPDSVRRAHSGARSGDPGGAARELADPASWDFLSLALQRVSWVSWAGRD